MKSLVYAAARFYPFYTGWYMGCEIELVHIGEPISCAAPKGGGGPDPSEKSQNIGFLCNTGPDPLKNQKATKPAFNIGPSSARQQNAIYMAFCWRVDDGPLIVVFVWILSPL